MHELFEHKADVGVRGIGKSLAEAFAECARAMTSVMIDLEQLQGQHEESLNIEAESKEELLVEFLNDLLYLRDVKEVLFNGFELYITNPKGKWVLKGKAFGDILQKGKHSFKIDVKAASFHQIKVGEEGKKFVAQCVVDV